MQGGTLGLHVDLKPARFVVPFQRSAAFFVAVPFFAFGRLAAVCARHAEVKFRLFADIIDFCTERAVIKCFFGFSIRTAEKNGNAAAVAVAEHSHRTARAVALQFAIVEDIVGDAVAVEVALFQSALWKPCGRRPKGGRSGPVPAIRCLRRRGVLRRKRVASGLRR